MRPEFKYTLPSRRTWLVLAGTACALILVWVFIRGNRPTPGGGLAAVTPPVAAPVAAAVPAPSPGAVADAVQQAMNEAVARVRPAVVAVIVPAGKAPATVPPDGMAFIQPMETGNTVTGSGLIVDPAGYILTTLQTVGRASQVEVRLFSARPVRHRAIVLAIDNTTGLALLKIERPGVYPAAALGNSDMVEIGDIVFALGTPYGFSRSVSMGIISTNRRTVAVNGRQYPDLIQTDAALNKGDDGGALVNIQGEVIGINMAGFVPNNHFTGIGFALPINAAARLLKRR